MATFLLYVSFLIPLLGLRSHPPEVMILLYSIYGVAYLCRGEAGKWYERVPGAAAAKITMLFLATGALTETLAWTNNYLKAAAEPALFHPQLIPDLIMGSGFYAGWALAWLILLRWFHFTLLQAFLVTGFQGIFFEQLGAVFRAMVKTFTSNPLTSLLFGLYVFAVHGSIVGLALLPVLSGQGSSSAPPRSAHWVKFPLAIALMVGLAMAGCAIVERASDLFGGLPPRKSIVEYPLW